MKKLFFPFLFLSLFFFSCSTDFDITSDWKEIYVVYGLLDYQDSNHYVRINKAFLDPKKNALTMTGVADSISPGEDLEVKITDLATQNVWALERVNGETDGIIKEEGLFASSPNVLYKLNKTLSPTNNYELSVTNPKTGFVTKGQTGLVQDFKVNRPNPLLSPPRYITLTPGDNFEINWTSGINGKVYELDVRFEFWEFPNDRPWEKVRKSVLIPFFRNITANNPEKTEILDYKFPAEVFYTNLSTRLEENLAVTRSADSAVFTFIFSSGEKTLHDFIRISRVQGGLAAFESSGEFSNLDGDALGIFSSRTNVEVTGFLPSKQMIDLIACNSITRKLRFQNQWGNFVCP